MATETTYLDAITSARAMLLSEEEALQGLGMLSAETQGSEGSDSFYTFCAERFPEWLAVIRRLTPEQQELLLSYYVVGRTQTVLGPLFGCTQTIASYRLRLAVKVAGCFLMWGGAPTVEHMHEVLAKTEWENKLKIPLSQLIADYAYCRSFAQIALRYGIHRPDIRRTMSRCSKEFLDDTTPRSPEQVALGAYILSLVDRASFEAVGKTPREKQKDEVKVLFRTDPDILGQFRVDCADKNIGQWFVSTAVY